MMRAGDLDPESLRSLLLRIDREQALSAEQAEVAYRLARLLEQRYLDLERERLQIGSLLQRLCDIEQVYGRSDDL